MPQTQLRLIKTRFEFISKQRIGEIPKARRGIYVLYNYDRKQEKYNVVYVGLARNGFKNRLWSHKRSLKKNHLWTHFSVFEAWDNIRDEEIEELEGLFRHIYRRDSQANKLNLQRGYKKLHALPLITEHV